eukprot:540633-Amphidinium_carterae.1
MGRQSHETIGAESGSGPPSAQVSTSGLPSQDAVPQSASSDEDGLRAQIQELAERNRALQMELDEERKELGAAQDQAQQMNMREGELWMQTRTLEDRVELLVKECSELHEEVQEFEDSLPPLQQDLQEVSTKLGAERAKKVAQAIELVERRTSTNRTQQRAPPPPSWLRISASTPHQLKRALADAYEQLAVLAQEKAGSVEESGTQDRVCGLFGLPKLRCTGLRRRARRINGLRGRCAATSPHYLTICSTQGDFTCYCREMALCPFVSPCTWFNPLQKRGSFCPHQKKDCKENECSNSALGVAPKRAGDCPAEARAPHC